MAKYSENGRLVATDDDEGLSPVAALRAAMAEQARREEQGIRLLPSPGNGKG